MVLINKPTIQMNKGLKIIYSKTIKNNPYIPLTPYTKQKIPIIEAIKPEQDKKVNSVLVGAGGYGGKTILGSMLAAQYLLEPDYTCLVTCRNYAELLDTNSIWENLSEWCTDTTRLKDNQVCTVIKSPTPRIIAPNDNTIYFKAFDREDKKGKFKSASYDRIINDEASELPAGILQFQYRSMRNTSWIPRSIINLSNPGGESTEYLVEHYVDGYNPYVALDWRDNPHIDREAYKQSLVELDYIDQQYQMHGNWHYKPAIGDLINRAEAEAQLTILDTPLAYELISIDLAGKGKDKFAVVCYDYLMNGVEYIRDFNQTPSANPETMLLDFIIKHNPDPRNPRTSIILIEQEGGGSPEYALKYFQELIMGIGYNIPVMLKKPSGSKYQRARPLMHSIRYGGTKLNNEAGFIHDFIDESIELSPDGTGKSPNLVDSASLARNYLHTDVLGNKTTFTAGARIGG